MGFCEKCHNKVEYTVREVQKTKNIKGKAITYTGKEAFCEECGNEIFATEIRDYNLQKLDEAFRENEKLISVSDIESILKKYNIGKRPLSLLLGWGEGTLTRYLNGDIPSKQYSDILQRILVDPAYMFQILEQNKDFITEHAYRLCKQALENINPGTVGKSIELKNESKIDSVVKYLLINSAEITPMALQKLLYYAQGFHKAFNGEFLFQEDCEAWVHGPVFRNVYYKYKDYGYNPIEGNILEYGKIELIETEEEILKSIIANFGCYSGRVLENMTHAETPWRVTRNGLDDHEGSERVINKELITDYFSKIKSKYNMLNISDIEDYSTELFRKLYH